MNKGRLISLLGIDMHLEDALGSTVLDRLSPAQNFVKRLSMAGKYKQTNKQIFYLSPAPEKKNRPVSFYALSLASISSMSSSADPFAVVR